MILRQRESRSLPALNKNPGPEGSGFFFGVTRSTLIRVDPSSSRKAVPLHPLLKTGESVFGCPVQIHKLETSMWRLRLLVALVIPIVCLRPAEAVDRPENLAWATAFGADDDAGTGAGTLLSVAGHGNVLEMENSDAGQAVARNFALPIEKLRG